MNLSSPVKGLLRACTPQIQAPKATVFSNTAGDFAQYYFKNNPWKLSSDNNFQKIYRFCIICGDNRFTDQQWIALDSMWGKPPTICRKMLCYNALEFLPGFVPRKHYIIETHADQLRVKHARTTECFEELNEMTSHIRFDKVYASEEEIPAEFLETFKRLEKIPVETRTAEIDQLYFDFRTEHNIQMPYEGMPPEEEPEPFLRELRVYRQKSIAILQSLEKRRQAL